jgi:hypothetical protein
MKTKIRWLKGRAGSTPAPDNNFVFSSLYARSR